MRTSRKLLMAAAVAGVVAAGGGSAFTNANTIPASVAGYGSSTISGAVANSVVYALSTDGTQITGATIVFQGDQTGRTVQAGFGTGASTVCTDKTLAAGPPATTTVVCSGFTESTSGATTFNVAVA